MNLARQCRFPGSWILRFPGLVFRVALPICIVIPILSACHQFVDDKEEDPCVETHDRGCLSEPEFQALVEEIAAGYAEPSGFQNQWGLAAVNADVAYANLELQLGPDVAPGEGVTVGILDTGIDGADPAFRNKTVVERFLGALDESPTRHRLRPIASEVSRAEWLR